jgi:hypothetical protein
LHWQIGGVLALEDAIDVTGRATSRNDSKLFGA